MDHSDQIQIRIRDIQGSYPDEHWALVDWGVWSRTFVGFGQGVGRQSIWSQGKPDETDAYGDVEENAPVVVDAPAKNERVDESPEDPRRCVVLDERIHAPGGLNVETRHAIRAAYVLRYVLESQYHRAAGCSPDAFCERLEAALKFVRRFI